MKPAHHAIISAGVSAIFSLWAKSWIAVGACFLSGIFIDLDHHLDYFLARKEIPLSYKKLVEFCHKEHGAKLYLFLHSYELLIFFWFCIFNFSLNIVWLGAAIGVTIHVLCDEVFNPLRPLAYFFMYRMRNRFDRKFFIKKDHYE